ncbi:ead/Ea22-like family protein [Salmonella enterica]|nr:ead/Ea22-like family protein [Salmonella enterica]
MTIDKQALREVAEKVNSGEWSYEEFNRMDLPGGTHININGRDAIYCLKKPVGGVEQSRAVIAFIAAFNPKVALALLDELEAAEKRIAELEARTVKLPAEKFCPSEYAGSQYWEETEVWNKALSACADSIRAAGIKVEVE